MAKRRSNDGDLDFSKLDPGLSPEGEVAPAPAGGLHPKIKALLDRLLSILKLVLGLCFLAFVYTGSVGFLMELNRADRRFQDDFWSGVIAFVIVYLFFYEPAKVYQKGQKVLTFIFKFFAPLVKVAPYVLPVYTIIIFALYPLARLFNQSSLVTEYFLFFGGFSLALHLVMTAKSLKSRQGDFLKANYIFGFSLVYIINLIFVALCMALMLNNFSFVSFFANTYETTRKILEAVFKQVFVL